MLVVQLKERDLRLPWQLGPCFHLWPQTDLDVQFLETCLQSVDWINVVVSMFVADTT